MSDAPHLTSEQLAAYRRRSLPAAELLRVDSHLSACDSCRGLFRPPLAELRNLQAQLSEHLAYEQIAGSAERDPQNGPPEVQQHLAQCAMCRAEVEDLRRFRARLDRTPARRRVPYTLLAAAAALALALVGTLWLSRPAQRPSQPAQVAVIPLPPDQRAAVELALATHKLERAPVLDRLLAKRAVLRGAADARTFEISSPMGTAILTDRPLLRWQPLPGATAYTVAIFDENFEKVIESPSIAGTEWQPVQPLPSGRILNWQVTAESAIGTVRAPVPPAPQARFTVMTPDAVAVIERARREHPDNHLLAAVLCARAGALDEAANELEHLSQTDRPTSAVLLGSLAELRKP